MSIRLGLLKVEGNGMEGKDPEYTSGFSTDVKMPRKCRAAVRERNGMRKYTIRYVKIERS